MDCQICLTDPRQIHCESGHWFCVGCFDTYVAQECTLGEETDVGARKKLQGKIECPMKCGQIFETEFIRQNTSKETYELYEVSLERFKPEPSKKSSVQMYVDTILENILTSKCPNCFSAYFDFSGCMSVVCKTCNVAFCGTECGFFSTSTDETHTHVVNKRCPHTKTLFMRAEKLQEILIFVKSMKILNFLTVTGEHKAQVLEELKKHLTPQMYRTVSRIAMEPPSEWQKVRESEVAEHVRKDLLEQRRQELEEHRCVQEREALRLAQIDDMRARVSLQQQIDVNEHVLGHVEFTGKDYPLFTSVKGLAVFRELTDKCQAQNKNSTRCSRPYIHRQHYNDPLIDGVIHLCKFHFTYYKLPN